MEKITHSDLIEIGYKYLIGTAHCGFAFKELTASTSNGEQPDVIGFRSDCSILLEAKVSRSDFLADKKKHFRRFPELGMGSHRFYICPKGLIKIEELPEGWGLIYVNEKNKPRIVHKNYPGNSYYLDQLKHNIKAERALMYSALRRLQIRKRIDEIYEGIPCQE